MERVQASDDASIVTITSLRASKHYLVMVESCSASGVTSSQNSTIGVTTLSVVDVYGAATLLGILIAVVVTVVIAVAIYFATRYLYIHFTDTAAVVLL